MNWRWFKKRVVPEKILPLQVKVVHVHDLTLENWQTDQFHVDWARTNPQFAEALAVLRNLAPSGYPLRSESLTDIQAAVELGRKEGYSDALAVLLALRQFPAKSPEQIIADYDDTNYDNKNVDSAP